MKIYVASKFESAGRASALMRDLERAGHTVSYDWTKHSADTPTDELAKCAQLDLAGVSECEVFVLLWQPDLRGALVEMGAALAYCHQVICVGVPAEQPNIFFRLSEIVHLERDGQVRDYLEKK